MHETLILSTITIEVGVLITCSTTRCSLLGRAQQRSSVTTLSSCFLYYDGNLIIYSRLHVQTTSLETAWYMKFLEERGGVLLYLVGLLLTFSVILHNRCQKYYFVNNIINYNFSTRLTGTIAYVFSRIRTELFGSFVGINLHIWKKSKWTWR